jgi:hypothetical protein
VAVSADGRSLATAGSDRVIRVWEIASARQRRQLEVRHGDLGAVAFSPDGRSLAAGGADGTVGVWDLATGEECRRFTGLRGPVRALAFTPDGRRLSSGSDDTTALVWDVAGLCRKPPVAAGSAAGELDALWADLASTDGFRAERAVRRLGGVPAEAVPLLARRLRPARPADPARLVRLIGDLDSGRFAVRARAARDLQRLGEQADPLLRRAVVETSSPEVRRRAGQLLEKRRGPVTAPEALRVLRAVEVLEYAGTAEARQVLRRVVAGAPEALLTREAEAALRRLDR